MLAIIEQELRNSQKNTQIGITEIVVLVETDVTFITSNFHPKYFTPSFPDENPANVDEDFSQAYFWSEEWQKAESEATEDIRMGRVKSFNSVDDLIAELQS